MTKKIYEGAILLAFLLALSVGAFDEASRSRQENVEAEAIVEVVPVEEVKQETKLIDEEELFQTVEWEEAEVEDAEDAFYIAEISDELFQRMYTKSYKEDCTVAREDLRYLHLLHKDLEGNTLEGEMVVNEKIAQTVLNIFQELYEADYPIEKIRLIDEYDADDELSMEDNNTSCFNFRFISQTNTVSKHGLGMAVDINPLYNPYIKKVKGKETIEPATATAYTDRTLEFDYKIDENDLAYKLFTEAGFSWGGSWNRNKDYQHFEMNL